MSELQKRDQPPIISALDRLEPEIRRALPAHMDPKRLLRVTLTQIRKTPKLIGCEPASFYGALLTAAALGLEPGVNGEAYLVPYKRECQLILGYQGLAKLFWQHPKAKRLAAEYVCANDYFVFDKGLNQRLEHTPAVKDRGPIIGYYAIAELTTGGATFDYFTPEQIKALRGGRIGTTGDIADPERWMERKTAVRQVLKLLPKSAQLETALRVDETTGSLQVAMAANQGESIEAETIEEDES